MFCSMIYKYVVAHSFFLCGLWVTDIYEQNAYKIYLLMVVVLTFKLIMSILQISLYPHEMTSHVEISLCNSELKNTQNNGNSK